MKLIRRFFDYWFMGGMEKEMVSDIVSMERKIVADIVVEVGRRKIDTTMLTDREKAIKRDRKKQWVHYLFGGHSPLLIRRDGKTTACGKSARRISGTLIKNHVTCPRCIETMEEE